jgi:Ketol-acid reductoisomerase
MSLYTEVMRKYISNTAKYGGLTRGPRVIEENLRKNTKEILEEITFRKFAKEKNGY